MDTRCWRGKIKNEKNYKEICIIKIFFWLNIYEKEIGCLTFGNLEWPPMSTPTLSISRINVLCVFITKIAWIRIVTLSWKWHRQTGGVFISIDKLTNMRRGFLFDFYIKCNISVIYPISRKNIFIWWCFCDVGTRDFSTTWQIIQKSFVFSIEITCFQVLDWHQSK